MWSSMRGHLIWLWKFISIYCSVLCLYMFCIEYSCSVIMIANSICMHMYSGLYAYM